MQKTVPHKEFPLAAGQTAVDGEWAIVDSGVARRAGAEPGRPIGKFQKDVDNSGGEDGDQVVGIQFSRPLVLEYMVNGTGADEVTASDIGEACYWLPDQSVTARAAGDDGAAFMFAGTVWDLNSTLGVGVEVADRLVVAESSTPLRDVRHEFFHAPEPTGTALGTISESTAGPSSPTAQPGHSRTLQVRFDAGYTGGNIVVASTAPDGSIVSETFVAAAGSVVQGTALHAVITSFTNTAPAGAADLAMVECGDTFGVGGESSKDLTAFRKLTVDGTAEAFAATNLSAHKWKPTTAPNGERNYSVWYTQNASYAGALS